MDDFANRLMIRYLDPAQVDLLLVPPGDTARRRVRALLASVYEPHLLEVKSVDSVVVSAKNFQVSASEPLTLLGDWEKLPPQPEQARVSVEIPRTEPACWTDMSLETTVTVRTALTQGALEDITADDIANMSEQEFTERFAFLDLPELMRKSGVGDYEELQADFSRLYHLHFADPPPFDPAAPVRKYRLPISVLFFPDLDLVAALRRLVRSRRALNTMRPHPGEYEGGAILASSAWLAVFPSPPDETRLPSVDTEQVSGLLASEGFVAAFENLP